MAAKPNEIKRRNGNPGKQKLPDLNKVIALPRFAAEPPAHLTETGITLWREILNLAPWIANTDGTILLELCEKMELKKQIQDQLKPENFILFTDKGYAYQNPLFGMLSTVQGDIVKNLSLLGLTPSDRSKLGVAEVKARGKLEELLQHKRNATN